MAIPALQVRYAAKDCKVHCRTIFKIFGHNKEKYAGVSENSLVTVKEDTFPLSLTGKPRLSELSLKGVAQYMMSAQCQNILVLSGHGISSAAGIPNYRKFGGVEARQLMGEKGYSEKFDADRLFDKSHFMGQPYGMLRFVQALWPGNHRPTYSHYFVRTLQEKGLLLRNWTENVDNLERLCGIRDDKLIEFSGTLLRWKCHNQACGAVYDLMWLKERLEMFQFPNCSKCFQKCQPDIPWYHEPVTEHYRQAQVDAQNCDLLIILGSDMLQLPFASIPKFVGWDVPRLLINSKPVENDTDIMDWNVSFDFDSDQAYRDVYWEGSTDLGVLSLCSYLAWDKDVKVVMDTDTAMLPGRKEMQERLGLVAKETGQLEKLR